MNRSGRSSQPIVVAALLVYAIVLCAASTVFAQGTVLVEQGSAMRYLPNTSDPGPISWTSESYPPESLWDPGVYGVGYDSPAGSNPLITTNVLPATSSVYTRAEFIIADVTAVDNLFLRAEWDDGYMAWINGVEVFRSPQMPTPGTPFWNTPATLHESSNGPFPDYGEFNDISDVARPELHDGVNVLAIGVWNAVLPSSDLVLVPQLLMNVPAMLSRGPYLQIGTDTGMVVRWRTSAPTNSRVVYTPAGGAPVVVDDLAPATEHIVSLVGLSPATQYFYSVGTTTEVMAGDDPDHYFRTAPTPGARQPIRFWTLGDSGTANINAEAVRDAYLAFAGTRHTDLWLMPGGQRLPDRNR